MTLRKFTGLLGARGADLDAWPERDRGAASDLLARSPDARALLGRAGGMDRVLNEALKPVAAPESLRCRVASIPLAHPREAPRSLNRFVPARIVWLGAAAATAASLAAGITIGALFAEPTLQGEQIADLDSLVFGVTETESLL